MAPRSKIPYNPADLGASNTLLPEEVFGHVDLATLADIHKFLRESELQDDIELAAWVQENYLNGHIEDHSTAIIRTAQGFGQLDRAFRRVRSLTNKAQEKWPFFDRNFKQMSTTTVRNNARGEAAPGIMYSIESTKENQKAVGQQHTSVSNGLDTPKPSPVPQLQVPFGTAKPSRFQTHKSQFPSPARRTRVSSSSALQPKPTQVPEPDQKFQQQEIASPQELPNQAGISSEPSGQAMNQPEALQAEDSQPNAPRVEETPDADSVVGRESPLSSPPIVFEPHDSGVVLGKEQEADTVRDAGHGKVRGPDGRYLPSNEVLPVTKKVVKTKKPKKGGRKPGLKTAEKDVPLIPKAVSEESGVEATEESISTDIQCSPSMAPTGKTEGNDEIGVFQGIDTVTSPDLKNEEQQMETETTFDTGVSAAYLLAAEADAVPSNLDRLPPSSRKAVKRKSEPTAPSSARKRGKYGGIVGRPRRTDQPKISQKEPVTEVQPVPQMQTRRNTRHSAAANLGCTGPTTTTPTLKANIELPVQTDDVVMGGVEGDMHATPGHEEPKPGASEVPTHSPAPSPRPSPEVDILNAALMATYSPARQKSISSSAPLAPAPTPDPAVANEKETAHVPGHVELIARITTGNGTMELPISEDQIDGDEVKMIRKYAEWNAAESAVPVPYAQFRKIFSFAKEP
ncbi:hypothetical protein CFE70_007634 [Pyrenophora teres f. teres 0-1]|uniref:Uncharacterized protein n=2 Tax=Pyrenophora teres f. teres TaxID=97479 RepID=E3RRE2_PYRTT|nr:hypothetical protein PTT_11365 [Pyrenophora teres f. teres 0-1]KAE8825386.1 hypothetical protein HRS9139_08496 [Pyrenophora teres f. teres]KAE8834483.1 hypothetical protein PTNB85_05816 [Pyrenophora teres f. teres]KAE8860770.1 hypothetical protein PTNB29_05865 [Pyrenophora teres f. teres]CAE7195708.1 hypothetical protein PTTW11_08196 [Pyrenophora teres f. teres]